MKVEKSPSLRELELHAIPCAKPITGVKVSVYKVTPVHVSLIRELFTSNGSR